jgi:hypothetical protein
VFIENDSNAKDTLYGTNLGYVIDKNNLNSRISANVYNQNTISSITVLIALIAYNINAPVPGAFLTNQSAQTTIQINEISDFLFQATIRDSRDSLNNSTESEIEYETYYAYIDTLNFGTDSYFDVIEMMMHGRIYRSYRVSKIHKYYIKHC